MIGLGSVNIIVKDIRAAEQFYVETLGLTVDTDRSNRPSFLLLRAANCMVILQEGQPAKPDSRIELGFAVDDVDAMREKLGERAVVQQMGWGNAIETEDPDGTRLNLFKLL
jgi:catechol 2,3-dioxygenase-like lactoylglutathione lyase family enzyme